MDWREVAPRLKPLFEYVGTEDERAANWEGGMWHDFCEWVSYRKADNVPQEWVSEFQVRAEEQRSWLLKLYGLR
jgi:hypothetical protein